MTDTILIGRRFCGPPESGNGGYVCGRLAAFVAVPARVRLRVPPPLDVAMELRRANEGVRMVRGETVVAEARPAEVALEIPAAPSYAEAEAAARSYRGFRAHPFPTCFVCGPQRAQGDGLRIFAGPVAERPLVAAPWIPDASLAGRDGKVNTEFMWAALDCPGAYSFPVAEGTALLLGELAASLTGSVAIGERCVVIGWELGHQGRRHFTATALFSERGECAGYARATWFEVRDPA